MKVDRSTINNLNKNTVLYSIYNHSHIYKAEISRKTGLSIPTVMKITDELIRKGLVKDVGLGESNGGKPPMLLEFVYDAYYIIGVDIGTTNILAIMMDMSSQIVAKVILPTHVQDPSAVVIERIVQVISELIRKAGIPQEKLLGIGIGMPGLLDRANGKIVFSPDFKWENVDIVTPLRKKFHLPIVIENVTRVMALGEQWFGYAAKCSNFLCVNLGYGIGSAICINGELYRGASGSSGELGHMVMEKNGPQCECGNFGCLEALASGNAIRKRAVFYLNRGEKSLINQRKTIDQIEAKDVFEAAQQGDRLAREIVHSAAEYIGIAIANVINFIDPQIIILEGGISRAQGLFPDTIRSEVSRRQMKHAGKHVKIFVSQLGENAAAIGAASMLMKRLFETGGTKV